MANMRLMDTVETRSKHAFHSAAASDETSESESDTNNLAYNAKDFMTFLPWACAKLNLRIVLELTKAVRIEKVSVPQEKQVKGKSKLFNKQPKTMLSESDLFQYKEEPHDQEVENLMVRMLATFTNNMLTHVKIHTTKHIPRQLIKILSHIAHFYPGWSGFAINSGADQYTIYELCKLLQLSHITEVCLDNTYVPQANFSILLDQPSSLNVLSLSRCKMGDIAFKNICSKLEYPKPASETIVSLSVSSNHLSDDAAKAIGKMLRSNRKLKHLNLANNFITDEGAQAILESLNTFLLTEEEYESIQDKYFQMLKWKISQEIKRLSTSQQVTSKPRAQSITKRIKSKNKKLNIRSKENLVSQQNIPEPNPFAYNYQSTFMVDCFRKDGKFYNKGNNTLAHLSLAYNKLSYFLLPKLLHVLDNQKKDLRYPRGLVKIVVEGNRLPTHSKELKLIDILLHDELLTSLEEVSSARKLIHKK